MDAFWKKTCRNCKESDVSAQSIDSARVSNPEVQYDVYEGSKLPYADASFDACVTVCVMHHVPPDQWLSFMKEMSRVAKPGGMVTIFEHNPYNPVTRVVVSRCEFDDDAVLLRPGKIARLGSDAGLSLVANRSILYFPWRGKFFRFFDNLFGRLPMGAQYFSNFRKRA
jgi:SAM-dependent methyltransferase